MRRRTFLGAAAAACWAPKPGRAQQAFAPWTPGTLEIHHLAYGRGNSTFVLGPDGTTLLIDAGTTEDSLDVSSPQRPNDGERPGQWIARYVQRHMRPAGRRDLDYFLLTHIHPDHLGDLGPHNPRAPTGDYRLTGVMDVDALLPIAQVIDRGFPDYRYPAPQQAAFALNYLQYIQQRADRCERFHPGVADQFRLLRRPADYPAFHIRNLAANGDVWTGDGEATRPHFPALSTLKPAEYPTENMCSAAIRLSYGAFRYFTGGDLTCDTNDGDAPWRDIESPVARACGPVDVAVADHHAYFDAGGPDFVRALRPQAFIVPAWYVAHPTIVPLRRMAAADIFATNSLPANRAVNNQYMAKVRSFEGHIVVRVSPGGGEFRVTILDNADDSDRVKAAFGPYRCA